MTAKTGKDQADEVEAVPAEERAETAEAAARPARPAAAKRKRRVRVIEVIDDEDLDEVLEALDAEDDEAEETTAAKAATAEEVAEVAEAEEEAPPSLAKPAAKPRPSRIEPPAEKAEEAPPAGPGAGSPMARPGLFGLPVVATVVFVVLVALLASLAIWKWTSASSLSSKQDDREAVGEAASAYGNVALNYNAQNYQSQMDKAQKLMGGDLLESFKTNTLPSLGDTFKSNPELALTSKTNQVFVGSVDGKFATAVVMVDITVRTKEGSTAAPATLLRLALAKVDGTWKITKQYASGTNDQNQPQQTQLPGTTPGDGASKAPKSEKPKN
ncbi:hypothetical protein [Actinomadura sp. BRA 177]|uniref:hypothetical protein n=1 Tax=Actinomadura sp. BRA 177 TaxID=2745202 RepID=UPI001595C021|nr:hypothetical protein [Actinomadura sp. BRA 177]NVI85982.1 hypothetical protein [Actinomadura sp. BRA 177]